jgi:hypothetical protein
MRSEVTRHEDGSSSWKCDCGKTVNRFRGQGDVSCECGQWFNAFGQRLRNDWMNNPSNYDDEISDLEGYEMMKAGDE